jgi:tetratricopeptide (TPR) repeat protein
MRGFWQELLVLTALVSTICPVTAKSEDQAPVNVQMSSEQADDDRAPLPKESAEAVKQANELHRQAAEQFKLNNLDKAIALDEQAAKVAPHYWLPHSALAYLYSCGNGGPALEQAAVAVKCEHPLMAETNNALLMQSIHMVGPAIDAYKRLLAADPTSWRAKIGLAQCYIMKGNTKEASALLDELSASQLKDPAALLAAGYCYNKLSEREKAKDVLKRGLAANPEPKLIDRLNVQLFEIAVQTDDLPLILELKSKVGSKLEARQRTWLRSGNIKLAASPKEAKLAFQIAQTETLSDRELRDYARVFEKNATATQAEKNDWLALAKEALTQAGAQKPQSLENRIMLASIDEQLGDTSGAIKVLRTPSPASDTERDSDVYTAGYYKKMRKADDQALASLFATDGKGYKSYAQSVDFQIPAANCRCKVNSAKSLLKTLPGVFDVIVGPGDKPNSTLIFDARRINRQDIFENPKLKNFKEKIDVAKNEKPVATITELAQIYGTEDQTPVASSPSVQLIVLQYPTVDDATTKVSIGSKPAI